MYCDEITTQLYKDDFTLSTAETCEALLDEIIHDMKVRQVARLRDADQFGEQALLRDGVRTASVRTLEDTHLVYFTREDFQKVYSSIMQVKVTRRFQFLKAMPLFSSLSKHYLQKMTGMLQRQDLIRNQYVFHQVVFGKNGLQDVKKAYRENANCLPNFAFLTPEVRRSMVKHVYIVGKGEFEVSIKTLDGKGAGEEEELEDSQIIGYLRPGDSKIVQSNGPVKGSSNMRYVEHKITVVGPGNILALEDLARHQPHSYSVKCVSHTGTVLIMDVERFHQVVKHI